MNTIADLRRAIRQGIDAMVAARENDVLRIATDQIALIKLRVQTSGKNAQGNAFTPYTRPYAKNRVKAGFQAEYVDFTRTGRMWANVKPVITASSVISATVEIKATLPKEQMKVEVHSKRRGNILEPSKAEIDAAKEANRTRITKYFKF